VARLECAINLALHAEAVNAADRSAWGSTDPVVILHPSLQLNQGLQLSPAKTIDLLASLLSL
jgi:hypothetical protein